jgi:Iap family predicted aminopeptidase
LEPTIAWNVDLTSPITDPVPNCRNRQQGSRLLPAILSIGCLISQQQPVDAQAPPPDLPGFDRVAREGARGYEWLSWSVAAIGHRLTGSQQGARAEQAADSLFRLSGVDTVHRWPFEAQAWSRGQVALTVGDGRGFMHMGAVALANTPLEADVEAPVIDAGNGLPADLDALGEALRGKVAMVNLGLVNAPEGARNLHRSEKAALALERGVAAILFVNQVDGGVLLTGTASIDGRLIPVPAACIATESGAELRAGLARGTHYTARLRMINRSEQVNAHNVVAEVRGSERPDEVVLVGGHLDSWDLATGATDNGIGAFSILDLARAVVASGQRPVRTIRFVLFMGEEQGLLGSRALVNAYTERGELERIVCMVNLDMSGNPRGFGVGGPAGWRPLMNDLCARIAAVDSSIFKGEVQEELWLHSDHQPFLLAGVPVLYPLSDLGKHVYACYHSSCDDIHLVDPGAMLNNVRSTGMLLLGLASAPELPGHFTRDELRNRLVDGGLEGPLRIGGDWPF